MTNTIATVNPPGQPTSPKNLGDHMSLTVHCMQAIWYSRQPYGTADSHVVQQTAIWYSRQPCGTADSHMVQQTAIWQWSGQKALYNPRPATTNRPPVFYIPWLDNINGLLRQIQMRLDSTPPQSIHHLHETPLGYSSTCQGGSKLNTSKTGLHTQA